MNEKSELCDWVLNNIDSFTESSTAPSIALNYGKDNFSIFVQLRLDASTDAWVFQSISLNDYKAKTHFSVGYNDISDELQNKLTKSISDRIKSVKQENVNKRDDDGLILVKTFLKERQ